MNEHAKQFIYDAVQHCSYPRCEITEICDILVYSDTNERLLIDGSDIEKYYTGYVMSTHQTREDALKRAANYLDKIAFEWNDNKVRQYNRTIKK